MRSNCLSLLCAMLVLRIAGSAQVKPSLTQVIPAKVYNGYLVVVQGSIGSLEKRNLAIDTGAYPSVIDRSVAKKLHLPMNGADLRVIDHNINSQAALLPSLQVGPIRVTDFRVVVQDLTAISEAVGVRIDALVGFDVLGRSNFRIDYREKKVAFGVFDSLPLSAPLRWTDAMACVDLKVDGQPTRLLVDTGAASLLLFAQRLPWAAKLAGDAHPYSNLGGDFRLERAHAHTLELAGQSLGSRQVFVSKAQNMDGVHFDGLLALGALPFRQITFDFERQLLGWEAANSEADKARMNSTTLPRATAMSVSAMPPIAIPGPCASDATIGPSCGGPTPMRTVGAR